MSREANIKNLLNNKSYTHPKDWRKPTESLEWLSLSLSLTEIKSKLTYTKLKKKEKLNKALEECVNYIKDLPDNWDGYGAQPIKEETLKRACDLLENILESLWSSVIEIFIPLIQPVPDGSIDLNWESDEFELLINIPSEINKQVSFYGEKIGFPEEEIEARIHYDLVTGVIIPWLKKIL